MKKSLLIKAFILLFIVSAFADGDNPLFSIKFSGGMSWISRENDLKHWFQGEKDYLIWLGNQPNYSTEANYPFKVEEPEGSLELVFRPFENLGFSLGIGYTKRKWDSSGEITYDYSGELGSEKIEISLKNGLNIVPVTFSAIFSVPLSFLRANIFAGGGYYFAEAKFDEGVNYSYPKFPGKDNYKHTYSLDIKTRFGGAGFHAGAGLEIKIFSLLSFFMDAIYRNVELGNIKGELHWKEVIEWSGYKNENSGTKKNQTLWIGSFKTDGSKFKRAIFSEEAPSLFENAKPFKYNLSGVYLKAGLIISF